MDVGQKVEVPANPTREMVEAAMALFRVPNTTWTAEPLTSSWIVKIYKAMIAAKPNE